MLDAVFPVVPGWAVSGVVVQPGVSVTEFTAGDEVVGYVREDFVSRGTFAEYVAAPARTLARKPRNVSFEKAAGRPLEGRPPQGVDAVLDTVGGEALKVSANLPAPEGRLASIADGVVDHGRCCWVCPGAEDLFRLTGLVEEGAPSVHASETFPPERAVDAHRLSQEGRTRGGPW